MRTIIQPLHIRGATVWNGHEAVEQPLLTDGEFICAQPHPKALEVDLSGCVVFPALVNAHDHLELNHYPRSKFRDWYANAHQWGEDMNKRLGDEPFRSLQTFRLEDRCFIGGLKNLLCGATMVAHHNPPHHCLFRKDFPVRVLRDYGWAHSLHFDTPAHLQQTYRQTPRSSPWFIHLAEGTDESASQEYRRLLEMGCAASNTVIVHAVGLSADDADGCVYHIRGIIICPTTNQYLLNQYPTDSDVLAAAIQHQNKIAIGSDSRLTADGDLLDEMRFAAGHVFSPNKIGEQHCSPAHYVVQLATQGGASIIGAQQSGTLSHGHFADWIAIRQGEAPPEDTLCQARRADLALVVKGGVPQIGDPEFMRQFTKLPQIEAQLDGQSKHMHSELAKRVHNCRLKERGLEVEALPKRTFRLFSIY